MQQRLSLKAALSWVLLSTLLVSGCAGGALWYYHYLQHLRFQDPRYQIVAIWQTSTDQEALKTTYLAELMHLSLDRPTNLYRFHAKEAQKNLMKSPVIQHATVRKIKPGMVAVTYKMRQPVGFLKDFTNAAVDEQGVIFPFKPFFTPKRLPEIYLGVQEGKLDSVLDWGMSLQNSEERAERWSLAKQVLQSVQTAVPQREWAVQRVDVSLAFSGSEGQRQIVVVLEQQGLVAEENLLIVHMLRLPVEEYRQGIAKYLRLRKHWEQQEALAQEQKKGSLIIDLRLEQLAFLQKI